MSAFPARSRRHIPAFDLLRPTSLDAVQAALAAPGISLIMAGGIDLIDALKHAPPVDRVVHLGRIPGLAGIREDGDDIVVGALTTHDAIIHSPLLPLGPVWRGVANPRIRFIGTIGGNLMARRPHYDALPALLALEASAEVLGGGIVPLAALAPGMVLTAIRIPNRRRRLVADRSLHPMLSVYATAADGLPTRIVVGGACPTAQLCDPAAPGAAPDPHALAAALPAMLEDGLASAAYRRRMAEVLTRRVLARLAA